MVAKVVRAMGCTTYPDVAKRYPVNRRRLRQVVVSLLAAMAFVMCSIQSASADVPAVTDFGSVHNKVQYVWQQTGHATHYAMFLTLYEDGRRQVDVRPIGSDEIVSFRTNHRAWELCPELMWFVNMPVYIKEIPAATDAAAI